MQVEHCERGKVHYIEDVLTFPLFLDKLIKNNYYQNS
jgi:hypothetical protein